MHADSPAAAEPAAKILLSRYAAALLAAHPELAAELVDPGPFRREDMAQALAGARADDESQLKGRLRRLRQRALLRVMARDLTGLADLAEVCATMSALAELEISAALEWLGQPDLTVVAMGKLGGGELNVSSDIDLIFLRPRGMERSEAFERAGRALIRLLSDTTEDGFAFRVDMRLRPYGDSGPLVCDLDFLEDYFVAQGREWERYAWIKARAISGDAELRTQLERVVRPFVYRKYLDYGTLAAMRRLHTEVRRDVARRDLAEHVKLGPGGIREIEFIVQALQLIRGGREPDLAVRPTLQALSALSRKNLVPQQVATELTEAYVFLRNVEHRLQYLDDAQRHELPDGHEERGRLATMAGFADWPAFHARLSELRASVTRHFEGVLGEPEAGSGAQVWPDHPRAASLRASQRYAGLPAESRARLDVLVPALAKAAAATPNPDETLARGIDLVEAISGRAAYLALLAENPPALERVARIVGVSSWAAQFLTLHPLLLDELLDDRVLYAPPDFTAFAALLRQQLAAHADDVERRMNLMRELHQGQVFRLLAQDLAGVLSVERLADHLSALADLMLEVTLAEAWKDLPRRHRTGPPLFSVVAYGKLGGKELGYASDLDVVFLYDDAQEQAQEVYARLAQRLITWLTTRTSAGLLFDTDMALRPSGASGLLVSSVEAFERYQERDAWVWEHQALTRARACAGDRDIGRKFEALREKILRRPREERALRDEIVQMRDKMLRAHPNRSGLFDLKHDRGGMIDVEFAVQYLVLGHSSRHAELTRNLGNIALLGVAAGLDLIPKALAEDAGNAYREFRKRQHALRLNGAQYARVNPSEVEPQIQAVNALWRAVVGPIVPGT